MQTSIDLYVFSGTGNTLLAARAMREAFASAGANATLRRMETSDPSAVDTTRTLGLAFPVACQSTYPLVWKFVRGLPDGNGAEAFMLDTLGQYSGGIVGPLRKAMERKGYRPVGAKEIVMPSNFLSIKPDEENRRKIAAGCEQAKAFSQDLLAGTAVWKKQGLLSKLMYAMGTSRWPWKLMNKLLRFVVDDDKCVRCGMCEKLCPVGNITMDDLPVFDNRCEHCMRCASFCPVGAIRFAKKKAAFYRAVNAAELIDYPA